MAQYIFYILQFDEIFALLCNQALEHSLKSDIVRDRLFKNRTTTAYMQPTPDTIIQTNTAQKSGGILTGIMNYLEKSFHVMPSGVLEGKLTTLPSMHRMRQMTGMTSGWLMGNYLGNIMAAQDLSHNPIPKEEVPAPLRWLHGSLEYNAFSDEPADREKKIVHQLLGGTMGGLGAIAGSNSFFKANKTIDKINGILEKAEKENGGISILEAEAAASAEQAKFWRPFAAVLGSFSAASGMSLPWVLNFGTSINTVFNSMGDRKAGTPLFSETPLKHFSNTTTDLPFGPAATISPMAEYVAQLDPKHFADPHAPQMAELKKYIENILVPLVPEATEAQKEHVLNTLKQVGEKAHNAPEATAETIRASVSKAFSGSSFDNLLIDMGVDVSNVHKNIGQQGFVTKFAEFMDTAMLGMFGVRESRQHLSSALEKSLVQRVAAAAAKASEAIIR